ncbi:hypothetical protein V7x_34790 [Crateriforma conspicua]|uniref:Transcobalamin-like C-terminal domain-containing protein n=2 Tax=Crateriforma conspicua TaxID=2527996 RepID=A0A5C6FI72_9PLAN|nr:hypothetical protein V7x_34790 [Crateriforma conspicua]
MPLLRVANRAVCRYHAAMNKPHPNKHRFLQATVLVALAFFLAIAPGCRDATVTGPATTDDVAVPTGPVTVEVISDDSTQTVTIDDVAEGTTLEDVMRQVESLDVGVTGSGEMAFVDSMLGQSTGTEGGWTFKVDGEFSKLGIGSVKLSPPTTVTWAYSDWPDAASE